MSDYLSPEMRDCQLSPSEYMGAKCDADSTLIERYKTCNLESALLETSYRGMHRILYLAASGSLHLSQDDGKRIEKAIKQRYAAAVKAERKAEAELAARLKVEARANV